MNIYKLSHKLEKEKEKIMRNYFQIEKTEDGIFIAEGIGIEKELNYDNKKYWNEWEEMKDEEILFARIRELLDKN